MRPSDPPFYNQIYLDVGEGPIVILLHGLFGNLTMWKSIVTALKTNYRVVIPRLPIFDLPTMHTNLECLTDALHDFIAWNQLSDVTIVGHGLGGQVALRYASRFPANVKRIVLPARECLRKNSLFVVGDFLEKY